MDPQVVQDRLQPLRQRARDHQQAVARRAARPSLKDGVAFRVAALVKLRRSEQKFLAHLAQPLPGDGPEEEEKLRALRQGVDRSKPKSGEVVIQLDDLHFLLDRTPQPPEQSSSTVAEAATNEPPPESLAADPDEEDTQLDEAD